MQLARPAIAVDPRRFGRRQLRVLGPALPAPSTVSGDIKLFAATFLAGFIFVSVLVG